MNEFLKSGAHGLGIEDFLNHTSRGDKAGGYLRNWTEDGEITLWLHRGHLIHPLWVHGWYVVKEVKEKDGDRRVKVLPERWGCLDYHPELPGKAADKIVRGARWRRDDGSRENPPQLCPMCLFEDWLSVELTAGRIGFAAKVFRFSPDPTRPDDRSVILHSGGILGLYDDRSMSPEEKDLLRDAKISPREAWKEKTGVKCQYLFVVVDHADASEGPKKYFASEECGDRLKGAIRKEMARYPKDPARGNPMINPYPIRLLYDDKGGIGKKYDGFALSEEPSDEILDAIGEVGVEAVDLSADLAPGNCLQLLTDFQTAGLIDAPWEQFFEPARREGLMKVSDERPKRSETVVEVSTRHSDQKPESAAPAVAYRCDVCDAVMAAQANITCKCGARYDGEGVLVSLACLACGKSVNIGAAGDYVCACGANHALSFVEEKDGANAFQRPKWAKVEEAKKPARRSRKGA